MYDVVESESGGQWFLTKSGILIIGRKEKSYHQIIKIYYNKCDAVKDMRLLQKER